MARMFRGRASFKSSEVAALFVLSLAASVVFWLILALMHDFTDFLFHHSK